VLEIDAAQMLRFGIHRPAGWTTMLELQGLEPGRGWHHIAASWSMASAKMCVYLDGYCPITTGMSNQPLVSASSGSYFTVGARCSTAGSFSEFFAGQIDEVRLWKSVRTASEISGSMYSSLAGTEPALIGYWKFDEGAGTDRQGQLPSKKDGTLTSSSGPTWSTDVPF